jgi:hypothetical protein
MARLSVVPSPGRRARDCVFKYATGRTHVLTPWAGARLATSRRGGGSRSWHACLGDRRALAREKNHGEKFEENHEG